MKHLSIISLALLVAATIFGSCNDSDYDTGEVSPTGVAVMQFQLKSDNNVLANLDSVFFSIDLVNARIYNADSLPYGTLTKKLVPSITTYDNVSTAELTVHRANGTDTIHNYLQNPEDTIDFSNGTVKLRLVSYDGLVERTYSIDVNVHKQKSDSLVWDMAARRSIPSSLSAPTEQHTAANAEAIYTLTRAGSAYSIAYTNNPFNNDWVAADVTLPSGAIVSSFNADNSKLYILVEDGKSANNHALYSSTDQGATWTDEGQRMTTIYGNCNGRITGAVHLDDNTWKLIDIYSQTLSEVPDGMPVSKTSNPTTYTPELSNSEQLIIVGGNDPAGEPVRAAWSFDGTFWAKITPHPINWACEEMTLVKFITFRTNSHFTAKSYPTLLAFGGREPNAEPQRTVYVSPDYGISWKVADELMQLPPEFTATYQAQAFVYSGMINDQNAARSNDIWAPISLSQRIPANATIGWTSTSRATEPLNEWECSYIYLFGGRISSGATLPYLWRATFNRLTYKPII